MLSVIVITKNEEKALRECLASVQFAKEIIVVDAGSTDQTLLIAKEFTAKVYVEADWQGFGVQKERALRYATEDWVLNIDADEIVSPALQADILAVIQSDAKDAYRIPIVMCFYEKKVRYSSSPKRHIRLFKRQHAYYSQDIVHEKIMFSEEMRIGQLLSPLMHRSYVDLQEALQKINTYSSYTASMRLQKKTPPAFSKVILGAIWMFFRCYIVKGGFLDGKAGFILAVLNAEGSFYRGMKEIYPDVSLFH